MCVSVRMPALEETQMSITHTKGPWFFHSAPRRGGGKVNIIQAGSTRGITVCTIMPDIQTGNSDRIPEVCEANAKLITQAPAMLELLESIYKQAHEGDFDITNHLLL